MRTRRKSVPARPHSDGQPASKPPSPVRNKAQYPLTEPLADRDWLFQCRRKPVPPPVTWQAMRQADSLTQWFHILASPPEALRQSEVPVPSQVWHFPMLEFPSTKF